MAAPHESLLEKSSTETPTLEWEHDGSNTTRRGEQNRAGSLEMTKPLLLLLLLKSNCRLRKAGWAKRDELKRGKEYYNVTLTASFDDVLVRNW